MQHFIFVHKWSYCIIACLTVLNGLLIFYPPCTFVCVSFWLLYSVHYYINNFHYNHDFVVFIIHFFLKNTYNFFFNLIIFIWKMKFIYFVLVFCFSWYSSINALVNIKDEWIAQKQDHFDETNNKIWRQVLKLKY